MFKHIAKVPNVLRIFKTRNTFQMFQTRCEYSKHILNVSNALLIFKMLFICLKLVANI